MDYAIQAIKKSKEEMWIEDSESKAAVVFENKITIGNDGPIIPGEDLSHIFEPFFFEGAKHKEPGSGLAIARKFVSRAWGRLKLDRMFRLGRSWNFDLANRCKEKGKFFELPKPLK